MSVWAARRFWTMASAVPAEGGFTVHLDGRPVRTPLKAPLVLPTLGLAEAVAGEWQVQEGTVKPETMPFTRTANSAIDKVATQHAEVVQMLAAYGDSDLLCYRAEGPPELVERQAAAWNPLLDWANTELGAQLSATEGVIHIDQPPASLKKLHDHVSSMTAFQLAAFHDLVAITGSLILALAVTQRRIAVGEAWQLSRIDEDWQISQWGEDEEAAIVAGLKQAALCHADRFYALCG